MTRNFSIALAAFITLLAIGVVFGLARDLYSTERAVLKGSVAAIDAGGQAFKSPLIRAPSLKVRLEDGRTVEASATQVTGIQIGQTIEVLEMAMPWGQLWYKLKT